MSRASVRLRRRPTAAVRLISVVLAALTIAGVVAPSAGAVASETYVALGDSYTAGPFLPLQLDHPPGCWRSDQNYPHLVARARRSALRDVSCSGAETVDLSAPQPVFGGTNPPQLDALDAGVDTVTVQIGGNDIGFSEILQRCTFGWPLGTPCRDSYTRGGVDEISRRIALTGPKVATALAEVRRRSPDARLFVVGYPAILPESHLGVLAGDADRPR